MDIDVIETSSQAQTTVDELSHQPQSKEDENKTKKSKSFIRPGPLSKKQKLETSQEGLKSFHSVEKNIQHCQSSSSTNVIPEKLGKTRILEANPKPRILIHSSLAVKARPGPLSKKLRQQECLTSSRSTPPPPTKIKNVEIKDSHNRSNTSTNAINSDDEIKTEIIPSVLPAKPLAESSVKSPKILHKVANKSIGKSKPTARPCPRSKKSGVVKELLKNTDSSNKNDKNILLLKTPGDCTSTIIKHKSKKKGHKKEKNCQANRSKILSNEAKSAHHDKKPITVSQTTNQDQHNKHNLQQIKWKEGMLKLQQEIGVPSNLNMVIDMFSTKKLMDVQESLNANKPLYLFELILPHIWMDLNLKDILKCRQVCGRWNRAVDNFLENYPSRGDWDKNAENYLVLNRPKCVFNLQPFEDRYGKQCSTFEFISRQKVQAFLAKVQNHPRNPFVTKAVLIRAGLELADDELSAFLDEVAELFRIYGKHISSLHLDIQGYHSTRKTFKMINQLLTLTPNLKSLRLMCHTKDTSTDDKQNEQMVKDSLPSLPNLESLDLCDAKFPTNLIGVLIKKYSLSLLKLQVSIYRWNEMYSHSVTNLRDLSITAMCSQDNLHHLYSQLENLQQIQRLTKLTLILMVTLDTKRLFGILQNFKGLRTIKIIILENLGDKLHFHNWHPGSDADKTESLPALPQVHSLELSLTPAQTSLIFLKWFPNLVNLHLTVNREYIKTMSNEISSVPVKTKTGRIVRSIKRCIVTKSATKSRIWLLLPSLQVLTVESDCYNRSHNDLCFTRDLFQ